MSSFKKTMKVKSLCPFSENTKISSLSLAMTDSTLELIPEYFMALATDENDAVAIELLSQDNDIDEVFTFCSHLLLKLLSFQNPRFEAASIETPPWRFSFAGVTFYPLLLTALYPNTHSRHIDDKTMILFLRETVFDDLVKDLGQTVLPVSIRDKVRWRFEDEGRPYNPFLSLSPYECYKIIKPIAIDGAVIRWWEAKLTTHKLPV